MKINKYPDKSSYVSINPGDRHNKIIFKLNSYEDLWHLNQFVDAFNSKYSIPPTIIIPNLIDAQADRRFGKNESFGLKLVCDFLNRMNAKFQIFHPHNPEIIEALIGNVTILNNGEFIKKIIYNEICVGPGFVDIDKLDNLILMSSDAGGFKPLIKLCDKLKWQGETYSASKSRDPKTGKLTQLIDRKDFKGKDILIIDDISIYGGTFKGLSTLLRERNCGKLYLAVSHMTVENLGNDPVTNYFDKIFTTNSKFDNYIYRDRKGEPKIPENLEVIKLF